MVAAGYAGWILLFDEVELVGRYSLLQRAKSYGEIARWVEGLDDEPMPRLGAVLAISDDFETAVIDGKNDYENVPNRLRLKGDELAAARAELGMRIIMRNRVELAQPSGEVLNRHIREAEGDPRGCVRLGSTGVAARSRSTTQSMRGYVRGWINEWDLRRLDPTYQPDIEIEEVVAEYGEDPELELEPEGTPAAEAESDA